MTAKFIISMLAATMCFSAASAQKNYEIGIPGNSNYDYLKDYAPLKQYVDHTKYPNFMLAAGIGVYDYKNDSRVKEIADNYYDEVVCGNAMKMGSCVDQNGNMSFGSVTEFVNNATASGSVSMATRSPGIPSRPTPGCAVSSRTVRLPKTPKPI